MRVLMRQTTFADLTGDRLLLAGEVYDLIDVIAQQWIKAGRAVEVVDEVKALTGAPENKAVRRKAGRA